MIREFRPDDEAMTEFRSLAPPMYQAEAVHPTATCLLMLEDGAPAARCSLEVTALEGSRVGLLGHYEAGTGEAGRELLRAACGLARKMGAERVIGPMNGSTWARYRLALPEERAGSTRPFLTEPQNPPGYPHHFEDAGFRVAAEYVSRVVDDLSQRPAWGKRLARRVHGTGVSVTTASPEHYEQELEELYQFSSRVFAGNEYYRPIPFAAFRHGYAALRPYLDPQLMLFARSTNGGLAGFCFAFPDRLGSTESERRVVLKTLAAAPEYLALGIGAHLADELHQRAAASGYSSVVHALMHVENNSVTLSHRFHSRPFRRYALYQWTP